MRALLVCSWLLWFCLPVAAAEDDLPQRVEAAMKQATRYFHDQVAVRGGYVYTYSADLRQRKGEGKATPTEIWVQPPGTPSVGMAYLRAHAATGDEQFLAAASDAGRALMFGQLMSGGWTASIDFDPQGPRADRYRNGKGRAKGRNYSTLDDDKTQAALRFLMELDKALQFRDAEVHEAVQIGLEALLAAQFRSGGFPQGWRAPVADQPVLPASFPDYDWRTENRIKEYWDYYTLNDGLAGTVARTLELAHQTYGDAKYRDALIRLGDFLLLAQLPEPQPGWAQQYDFRMRPMWARKFEPPAVSGRESEDAMETLLFIHQLTSDPKYLEAVRPALAWLKRSLLPDGQIARFYELQTNRPLYLTRDSYQLTYDDTNLPTHYGFKARPRIERIERQLAELKAAHGATGAESKPTSPRQLKALRADAERILGELDAQGRWLIDDEGRPVVGDANATDSAAIVSSERFGKNLTRLSECLQAIRSSP